MNRKQKEVKNKKEVYNVNQMESKQTVGLSSQ